MPLEKFLSPAMDLPDLTDGQKEWLRLYDMMEKDEKAAVESMVNIFISNRNRR